MKTLLLKIEAGQWMYMIIATNPCTPTTRVVVEWQYGTFEMQTTARQAVDRHPELHPALPLPHLLKRGARRRVE